MVFAANQRKVKANCTASANGASARNRRPPKPPRSSSNVPLGEEVCNKPRPRRARQLLRAGPASDSLLVKSLRSQAFESKGVIRGDSAPVRLWHHCDRNHQEGEAEAGEGSSKWCSQGVIQELERG